MARFPPLRPTGRSFRAGLYPVREYPTLSGVIFRRVFGNKPAADEYSLEFANIPDSKAGLILKHYYDQKGPQLAFQLPDEISWGYEDSYLHLHTQLPSSRQWHYKGPPQITSVAKGISTVTVELIAELEY